MISVLVPSRGRPEGLTDAVESLFNLAADPLQVEVIIGIDGDDLPTIDRVEQLVVQRPGHVIAKGFPERLGYSGMHQYYNGLAAEARGDWLVLFNDDATMTTHLWDDRLRELSKDVLVADLQSNLSPQFACFPAMRRELHKALGYFSADSPHVDSFIDQVALALGVKGTVDIFVKHDRPDLAGKPPDLTFIEGRAGLDHEGYFSEAFQAVIAADIERVRLVLHLESNNDDLGSPAG